MIRRFFQLNRRLCSSVQGRLPHARNIFAEYEQLLAKRMMSGVPQTILDVGGGRNCFFAKYRRSGTRIVAIDVSDEQLRANRDVDDVIVADVTRALPMPDASVDIITSRSVLEHLSDVAAFVAECRRVLKSGGRFIHLFPCKFAPFAIINQCLPQKMSRRAVLFFREDMQGICGFPAQYDRCYPTAIETLLHRNGFELLELRLSYYQSEYYEFFVPAYLLSAGYELIVSKAGIRNLCAYVLVEARAH